MGAVKLFPNESHATTNISLLATVINGQQHLPMLQYAL